MDRKLIERINELARKSRTPEGLSGEEKAEQARLRGEYLAAFRKNLEAQLNGITIQEPNGERHKLTRIDTPEKPVS